MHSTVLTVPWSPESPYLLARLLMNLLNWGDSPVIDANAKCKPLAKIARKSHAKSIASWPTSAPFWDRGERILQCALWARNRPSRWR